MKLLLLAGACSAALLSNVAAAQTKPSDPTSSPTTDSATADNSDGSVSDSTGSASGQDIVVTGSRAVLDGSKAPSPVTVASADQLQKATSSTLGEALNTLPQFRGSTRPTTGTTSALGARTGSYLNLRNLGVQRTLTLLDGRRAAPSSTDGSTDTNLFPQELVKRVDVVTGGASAAYGSDAVAGVVNFILDTRFKGLTATAQTGISGYGDARTIKGSLTAGTSFAGDRGRIVVSGSYYDAKGLGDPTVRDWGRPGYGFLINPAKAGQLIFVSDPRASTASNGGVALSGPFIFQQFAPGGALVPFNRGSLQSGLVQVGGDGSKVTTNLSADIQTESAFGNVEFDVTPNLTVFARVAAGWSKGVYRQAPPFSFAGYNGFTIFSGNAFLPTAAQTILTNTNTAAFALGRISYDFGTQPTATANTRTIDATAGFEFKGPWGFTTSGYYEHGSNLANTRTDKNPILENLYAAADAVRDPATNQIVCRVTLTNPGLYPGCVPINLFGEGAPSQAAINYVEGTAFYRTLLTQDVVSLSTRGSPFSTWAGAVSIAFGGEYRREALKQVTDGIGSSTNDATGIRGFPAPYLNQPGGFLLTNSFPVAGSYNVYEFFGEVAVPLARDVPFLKSLDFNGAVRYTHYSTSGGVTTYKAGLVWAPVSDIRFRGTFSRDIRAPNVPELFAGPQQFTSSVIDGSNGAVAIINATTGNPNLKPERADTYTGGVVLTPSFIPGLTFSADYYSIKIKDVISNLSAQVLLNQCNAGATDLCANVTRSSTGVVTRILTPTLNLNRFSTTGVDFELSYVSPSPVFGGKLALRAVVGYMAKYEQDVFGGTITDRAGEVGLSANPKWNAVASIDWKSGPFDFYAQERFISAGIYDVTRIEPTTIANNRIPRVFYTDATMSFDVNANFRMFLQVNNLFDQDPPIAPLGVLALFNPTNQGLYDITGRYFSAGVKIKF